MLRTIALVLLTAGLATSQVSFSFQSGSISARAGQNSNSKPSGTVSAFDRDPFGNTASAAANSFITRSSVTLQTGGTSALAFGQQFGLTGSAIARVVVRLSSPTPVAGTLKLAGYPMFFARIDVGNDGISESLTASIPVVIDAVGIEIAMSCQAAATAPFAPGVFSSVAVDFQSAPSRLLTALPVCGATLGGRIDPRGSNGTLMVTAESVIPAAATFIIIGVTPLGISIPPLGCVLGTDLVIVALTPINSQRRANLTIPLPNGGGGSVYMQFLVGLVNSSGNQVWRASNRFQIVL